MNILKNDPIRLTILIPHLIDYLPFMTTYQFLFHNTLGAIQLKKQLQVQQIPFKMMDAPRELTSSCGLSIRFNWAGDVKHFIVPTQTQTIYIWDQQHYLLYWQDN